MSSYLAADTPSEALPRSKRSRWLVCIVSFALGAVLVFRFGQYLEFLWAAIRTPAELDYGEGIVWQQAMLIPGDRMYGDITRFPFIVFHYPPIYHLVVHGLTGLGVPTLIAGRSLSAASSLLVGSIAAALAYQVISFVSPKWIRIVGALAAALVVFSMWPFEVWSPAMRVDMLALALSFVGVLAAVMSMRQPVLLYVAMTAFVAAVYTKQTAITAPAATMALMVLASPKLAIRAIAYGIALGLASLALLAWQTDGGFLRHILGYNLNRFSLMAFAQAGFPALGHVIYLYLAGAGMALVWRRARVLETVWTLDAIRRRLASDMAFRTLAIVTVYAAVATCSLITLAKSGSGFNYLIEWMCLWSIPIGALLASALASTLEVATPERSWHAMPALLTFFLAIVQVVSLPAPWFPFLSDQHQQGELATLEGMVRDAPKAVLSDDMVLLMRAGKGVPWEPAIFAELASVGVWNDQPMIDSIRSHRFSMIVTRGGKGDLLYDSRFDSAIDAAIEVSYPRQQTLAGHVVRRPAD